MRNRRKTCEDCVSGGDRLTKKLSAGRNEQTDGELKGVEESKGAEELKGAEQLKIFFYFQPSLYSRFTN